VNNWTELSADKQKVVGGGDGSERERAGGLWCRRCKPIPGGHQHVSSCKSHSLANECSFLSDKYQTAFMGSETIFDPAEK